MQQLPSEVLELIRQSGLALGTKLNLQELSHDLLQFIEQITPFEQSMLFVRDIDEMNFAYKLSYPTLVDSYLLSKLKQIFFNKYTSQEDRMMMHWLEGEPIKMQHDQSHATQADALLDALNVDSLESFPLVIDQQLFGIIILKNPDDRSIAESEVESLKALSPHLASYLANAYTYESKVHQLEEGMHEVKILSQIDEELNATIQLSQVFRMIMDWALRFTNAHAAALATYDERTDQLKVLEHYGYPLDSKIIDTLTQDHRGGITHRTARNGRPEVIPDVTMDSDYLSVKHNTRSQMSVPIMREERVEAVISLESKNLNGFTDEHLDFVIRLSQRAGVAVDNARLFDETEQERQKLELILSNIKDVVILVSLEQQILLINQSALAALGLYGLAEEYISGRFDDVVKHDELQNILNIGMSKDQGTMQEVQLPNGRYYHCQILPLHRVGWVMAMQDITHFKETDKLKSELLATASHDLKQPLSVMRGYLDLLEMVNTFDERSIRFVSSLNKAIINMQTLIDELLDLARIESGIELQMNSLDVKAIVLECIDANIQKANEKSMTVIKDLPDVFPSVRGDELRLSQIFNNLISNAIKYTPPEGEVRIYAEKQNQVIRISVQDNGLGISPEDKAQIFDRFYRVRRPETDSIEGTGLGLAIVKSLVEAHQGEISLVSQLNKGSTFHVTLPIEI